MYPPVNQLVPHQPPMLLLDGLASAQPDQARAWLTVRADNPFLQSDGTLQEAVHLELIAQAFAAGAGALAGGGQAPGLGYLVGVRNLEILGQARLHERLDIEVEITTRLEPLLVVQGRVLRGGEILAQGQVKIYLGLPEAQA